MADTDSVRQVRTPTAASVLLWSLAVLESAYFLTTDYSHTGVFAAYLWLGLDLLLVYRIHREGRYAWAALTALNVATLPAYLFSALGSTDTEQSAAWLPTHLGITLAILAILATPTMRGQACPNRGLPIAASRFAALLVATLALSSLLVASVHAGVPSHSPVHTTRLNTPG